mmetsp:Transcript_55496/g.129931  ORF Transcript_55496/g.129931 Transcript_55496/m.129931 type:complete len:112 (-) Transcript_55496:964-1299(-)
MQYQDADAASFTGCMKHWQSQTRSAAIPKARLDIDRLQQQQSTCLHGLHRAHAAGTSRRHFLTSFGGSMPDQSGLPMGEVRGQAGGNLPPDKSGKPMKLSNSETDETRAAG